MGQKIRDVRNWAKECQIHIKMEWVKSYSKIVGNENADEPAKEGEKKKETKRPSSHTPILTSELGRKQ